MREARGVACFERLPREERTKFNGTYLCVSKHPGVENTFEVRQQREDMLREILIT